MTIEDFEKLARARFDYCLNLMCGEKHKEYSRYDDKLYNFKRAAEILRCTSSKALLGMLMKHLVSIIDIIEDAEKSIIPDKIILQEKCGDVINYIILLQAIFEEQYNLLDKK